MVPSPTHSAAARAARACALGLALTLALGGSRPALAFPANPEYSSSVYKGPGPNREAHEKYVAHRARLSTRANAPDQKTRPATWRPAFLRGPAKHAPGEHQLTHLNWDYQEPREHRPGLSLGKRLPGERRVHPKTQMPTSRFGLGRGNQRGHDALGGAADRLFGGHQARLVWKRAISQPRGAPRLTIKGFIRRAKVSGRGEERVGVADARSRRGAHARNREATPSAGTRELQRRIALSASLNGLSSRINRLYEAIQRAATNSPAAVTARKALAEALEQDRELRAGGDPTTQPLTLSAPWTKISRHRTSPQPLQSTLQSLARAL